MKNSSNDRMDGQNRSGQQQVQYPTSGQMGNPNSNASQSAQINSTNASSNAGVDNTSRYGSSQNDRNDRREGMGRSESTYTPSNPSSSTMDNTRENYAEGARRSAQDEIRADRSSYGQKGNKDGKSYGGSCGMGESQNSGSHDRMHGEHRTDSRETSSAQQNIRSGARNSDSQNMDSQSRDSQNMGSHSMNSQNGSSQNMGSHSMNSQNGSSQSMGSHSMDSQNKSSQSMGSHSMNSQNSGSQSMDSHDSDSQNMDSQNKEWK